MQYYTACSRVECMCEGSCENGNKTTPLLKKSKVIQEETAAYKATSMETYQRFSALGSSSVSAMGAAPLQNIDKSSDYS